MAKRLNREREREMTYHTAPRYYIKRGGKYMDASGNFTRTLLDAFFATNKQVAEDFARREGGKVVKRNPFFRKTKVRRRVAKALKKYVRGNAGPHSFRKTKRAISKLSGGKAAAREWQKRMKALIKERGGKMNPPRVKGRKTKGGRAVTLKNFTGTIVKKSDGTVQIVGRGRRK